jgi:competence protein CoiA
MTVQLYALDEQQALLFANQAEKQKDYYCLECQKRVRLRGGLHRQNHFYHLEPNRDCRLNGKSMIHLQTQLFIQKQLPPQESQIEYRFPSIHRVADVAWIPHQIVFEIQCSPISAQELLNRNQDYRQLGWEIVWIFHDQRYNKWRLTAAEWVVQSSCHYFTNINAEGMGYIYDQFHLFHQGIRKHQFPSLPIHISHFNRLNSSVFYSTSLKLVEQRLKTWALHFQADLIDLNFKKHQLDYFNKAEQIEQITLHLFQPKKEPLSRQLKKIFYLIFLRPYWLFFQLLLEKMCR